MLFKDGKIKTLELSNFMIFHDLKIDFSSHINVISGENATGKTALLKLLYSSLKAMSDSQKERNPSADSRERCFVQKFQGVFRPDAHNIGRLVNRRQGMNAASILISFSNLGQDKCNVKFNSRQKNHMDIRYGGTENGKFLFQPIYIPPKEIISSTENFGALYREYQIAFEETYADLCYLLEKPLKKGPYKKEQSAVLEKLEAILDGRILQKENKFYLSVNGAGNFEMGLVSEGFRKLATIMYLIQSDSLNKDSIVFWDEPESNMNPKMILPIASALCELADMGVQVFVATHSYFVQQAFELQKRQRKGNASDIKFFSLYREEQGIAVDSADFVNELEHNAIMEEFDAVYDREQELFYHE